MKRGLMARNKPRAPTTSYDAEVEQDNVDGRCAYM